MPEGDAPASWLTQCDISIEKSRAISWYRADAGMVAGIMLCYSRGAGAAVGADCAADQSINAA